MPALQRWDFLCCYMVRQVISSTAMPCLVTWRQASSPATQKSSLPIMPLQYVDFYPGHSREGTSCPAMLELGIPPAPLLMQDFLSHPPPRWDTRCTHVRHGSPFADMVEVGFAVFMAKVGWGLKVNTHHFLWMVVPPSEDSGISRRSQGRLQAAESHGGLSFQEQKQHRHVQKFGNPSQNSWQLEQDIQGSGWGTLTFSACPGPCGQLV